MSWKFWQKPKAATPASPAIPLIDWNTDAYGSVKFLFGMYVKDTRPFSEWRDADAVLRPELEEVASTNVKAYQVWLWFGMYRQRRGSIEANMLRDAFLHLFDTVAPGKGLGTQVRRLLDFQDEALEYFHDLPSEKKAPLEAAMGVELPPEYYMAMYQLLAYPESPYRPGKQDLPENQQRALCVCLLNGKVRAQAFFGPMLESIQTFDPSQIPSWEWSKTMGAHERHLQRRHNNPLFAPARRAVTATDVHQARLLDAKAHDEVLEELEAIRQELRDTELPYTWFAYLNEKRERIEVIQSRIAVMDRCGDDLKPLVERLRGYVVGMMQDALKEKDPAEAAVIEKAEAIHARKEAMFVSDWVCQIRHPEKIIPLEEIIPALLWEDVESLAAIVRTMEQEPRLHESLAHARTGSLDIVRQARAAGQELSGIEDKLKILGVAL